MPAAATQVGVSAVAQLQHLMAADKASFCEFVVQTGLPSSCFAPWQVRPAGLTPPTSSRRSRARPGPQARFTPTARVSRARFARCMHRGRGGSCVWARCGRRRRQHDRARGVLMRAVAVQILAFSASCVKQGAFGEVLRLLQFAAQEHQRLTLLGTLRTLTLRD